MYKFLQITTNQSTQHLLLLNAEGVEIMRTPMKPDENLRIVKARLINNFVVNTFNQMKNSETLMLEAIAMSTYANAIARDYLASIRVGP